MKPRATIRERLAAAYDAVVLAQASLVTLDNPEAKPLIDESAITAAAERVTRSARTELYYLSANLPDCVLDATLDENDFDGSGVEAALRHVLQPQSTSRRRAKPTGGAR